MSYHLCICCFRMIFLFTLRVIGVFRVVVKLATEVLLDTSVCLMLIFLEFLQVLLVILPVLRILINHLSWLIRLFSRWISWCGWSSLCISLWCGSLVVDSVMGRVVSVDWMIASVAWCVMISNGIVWQMIAVVAIVVLGTGD